MSIKITGFVRDPVRLLKNVPDQFFDILGKDLDKVEEQWVEKKPKSGVAAALDKDGAQVTGVTIRVDWSTTPVSSRIKVIANVDATAPVHADPIWIVIWLNDKVVADRKGLIIE